MAKKTNIDINNLSTWPITFTLLIGFVIVGVVVFFVAHFFVDDVLAQIDSKEQRIVKQEMEYKKNIQVIAMLPAIRKEVAELEKARNKAKEFLPTNVSMPSLIDNVYLVAQSNGVVFDKFAPGKDVDKKYYTIKPISLSANVGFKSMASFIEQVTSLKRIMNIESVSFEAKGKEANFTKSNSPLAMTAELRTYVFKDDLSNEDSER